MLQSMVIRNRNKEVRRVRAGDLLANPANHRLHPSEQKAALAGILDEVGFVGTLLAFEQGDGRLRLIDGHLRRESLAADDEVDVTVVDLDPEERDKVLATHDALGAIAQVDRAKLDALITKIQVQTPAIVALLDHLRDRAESRVNAMGAAKNRASRPHASQSVPESWQVVVSCESEIEQREVYELLSARGLKCRLLAL